MIFYVKHNTDNILIGGTFTINGESANIYAQTLAQDSTIRDLVHSVCDFKIAKISDFKVPVVTLNEVTVNKPGMVQCTGLYTQLIKIFNKDGELSNALSNNDAESFKEIIKTAKEFFSKSKTASNLGSYADFFVECVFVNYKFLNYTTLKSFDNLPASFLDEKYAYETMEYINSFKKVIIIGDNKTLKQNVYNDEFFINIPSYYALTSDDLDDVSSLIPDLITEVCRPYTESIAYTPNYKRAVNTPIKVIEGQNSNNGNLIFEYNERYYKSLLTQVKENIKTYYEDAGNSSFLDADGELRDDAVIDPFSQEYLLELCKQLYSLHWAHNKSVPVLAKIDESDENQDSYSSAESKYAFFYDEASNKTGYINALILLEDYLKKVSTKCGYKIYVDAVIQLSRWGLDKPTALVFDNYDKVFILGTNAVKSKGANLEDCILVQHNGCDRYISGIIRLDKTMTDKGMSTISELTEFLTQEITIPVGICVTTNYIPKALAQSATAGDIITNTQYYSAIDFVREAVKTPGFIDGIDLISFKDGKFTIEDENLLNSNTISKLLIDLHNNSTLTTYNPFFRSEDLVNLYMDIGAKMEGEIPSSILTILNNKFASPNLSTDFKTISFKTKEELLEKKQTYQIVGSIQNAIDISILKETLPVFLKANKIADGVLSGFLNVYKQVMDEGFSTETSFYQIDHHSVYCEINKVSEENQTNMNDDVYAKECTSTNNKTSAVQKMNSFSQVTSNAVPKTDEQNSTTTKTSEKESKEGNAMQNSNISIYRDIIPSEKKLTRILISPEKTWLGLVIKSQRSDGVICNTIITVEDYEALFPGKLRTIKHGIAFKKMLTIFLQQYKNVEQIGQLNPGVFFYNEKAYEIFTNTIMQLL